VLSYLDDMWSSRDCSQIKKTTITTSTFHERSISIRNDRNYLTCSIPSSIQYLVYQKVTSKRALIVFGKVKKYWDCIVYSYLTTTVYLVIPTSEKQAGNKTNGPK
jgi:hypothetical protein